MSNFSLKNGQSRDHQSRLKSQQNRGIQLSSSSATTEETKTAAAADVTKTEAAVEETKVEVKKEEEVPPPPIVEEPPKAAEPAKPVEEKKEVIQPPPKAAEPSEPGAKVEEKAEAAAEEIKETIVDFSPDGINTIVQVNDLKNSPGLFLFKKELRQATNQALQLLQDNYPEFVAKQMFINVPWWYVAYNRMISPFFDSENQEQVCLRWAFQNC